MAPDTKLSRSEVSPDVASIRTVKNANKIEVNHGSVEEQQEIVADNLYAVLDYYSRYGTCAEDRGREGTLDGGQPEPRFHIFGGPAELVVVERSILLPGVLKESAKDTYSHSVFDLKAIGIKPGMHQTCAALNSLHAVFTNMATQVEEVYGFTKANLGDRFVEEHFDFAVESAKKVVASGKFAKFGEEDMQDLLTAHLGKTEAYRAIEKLLPNIEHEGQTIARLKRPLTAADSTGIYMENLSGRGIGKGTFIVNDAYCQFIENFVTTSPDSESSARDLSIAAHIREAYIMSVLLALPNPVLSQFDIN
jgi:hypothetical protein